MMSKVITRVPLDARDLFGSGRPLQNISATLKTVPPSGRWYNTVVIDGKFNKVSCIEKTIRDRHHGARSMDAVER